MVWTDLDLRRSHDELLADVRREGERRRRRRRLATSLAVAFAVVLPVTALVVAAGTRADRGVSLSVAGPIGASTAAPEVTDRSGRVIPVTTTIVTASVTQPASPPTGPIEGGAGATTTAPPGTVVPTTVTPVDDPVVVRPPPSLAPPSTTVGSNQAGGGPAVSSPPQSTTIPGPAEPPLPPCPPAQVAVSVTTEKASYSPGETVKGSSTLENRSGGACLIPTRAFFHIEDGSGKTVGAFAYTADYRMPTKAEPGKTVGDGFTWDQRNCSGGTCAAVPAGTYVAVADWTEGGPYTGRGAFKIGA